MEWCSVGYRQNIAWYSSKDDDDREGISAFLFSVFLGFSKSSAKVYTQPEE